MVRIYLIATTLLLAVSGLLAQEESEVVRRFPTVKLETSRWTEEQRQQSLQAQRAVVWLRQTNKPDGRFVFGFNPALRIPIEGDSFVAQAGAAQALAFAGKMFRDEASLATARQAVLTLLEETEASPERSMRYTTKSPVFLNRVASAGALLLAIHELPDPSDALLMQADQLASFLRTQQQPSGALVAKESAEPADAEPALLCAGIALRGLSLHQRLRPHQTHLDVLRRALAYYEARWSAQPSMPLAVHHTEAYVNAFLASRDSKFAELATKMSDWLCAQQYQAQSADGMPSHWGGGFQGWVEGKCVASAPDIQSAHAAEALSASLRLARAQADVQRIRTYGAALIAATRFLARLQYTDAKVSHYVESFRPAVLGAYHASFQDGTVRIDSTHPALLATLRYLEHAATLQ